MHKLLRRSAFLLFCILGALAPLQAAPKPIVPKKVVYIAIVSVDPAAMTITVEPRNSMSTEAKTYKGDNGHGGEGERKSRGAG